jgi:TonB family protein
VNTKKADILQVRKYLNGELNAKAMHRLESEALDDPFLMDALDGFENTPADQQTNLADLSARLQKRIEPQKGRVIAWRPWAIAASVLLVLTIGGLWMRKTPQTEKQLANVVEPDNTKAVLKDTVNQSVSTESKLLVAATAGSNTAPVISEPNAAVKPANGVARKSDRSVYQQEISAGDNKNASADVLKEIPIAAPVAANKKTEESEPSVSLSEMVVTNYTDNKADSLAALSKKAKDKAIVYGSGETKLIGKVQGLEVISSRDAKVQNGYSTVSGIIISKIDGMPVTGAAIRIQGTNKSTVTNSNGVFAMPATFGRKSETLDIASIGFQPRRVSVKTGDSLKVELNPDQGALDEVAVVPAGKAKTKAAHPQGDMDSFKKYLEMGAATTPPDVAGTVSVTFTVNADGSLIDIKIKKSLSPATDQKAIDLIKAGPTWVANSNGKPEQVTVKVKFKKE